MSLIASGFGLSTDELNEAGQLLHQQRYPAFREYMHPREIVEARAGSLFLTLVEFLDGIGVALPVNLSAAGAQAFADDGHLLTLADRQDAASALLALRSVDVTDAELRRYWEEFHGEQAPEAGQAMRHSIAWLCEVFTLGQQSEWCLVSVG
jgi:hypothetical protein